MWDVVRTRAAQPDRYPLSTGARGAMLRRTEDIIKSAADVIGMSLCIRTARLKLAEEVYERECTSYNQLTDNELYALSEWVISEQSNGLVDWLKDSYGHTEKLIELP